MLKTITIDTDQWAVVPKVPNDKLHNVLLEWCGAVEGAWFDILAAAPQPEQAHIPFHPNGIFSDDKDEHDETFRDLVRKWMAGKLPAEEQNHLISLLWSEYVQICNSQKPEQAQQSECPMCDGLGYRTCCEHCWDTPGPAPRPVPTLNGDDVVKIAIECGLQTIEEHWGSVYRAVSQSQLTAFASAILAAAKKSEPRPVPTSERLPKLSLTETMPHGHEIDAYIEEFLKASGSSFMNYSMASAREKMRDVMTRAMMHMAKKVERPTEPEGGVV